MLDFNFFDIDMFSRGTPHSWFKELRHKSPISWHPLPPPLNDEGFWLITKHNDICEIGREPNSFISHAGIVLADATQSSDPARKMVCDGLAHLDAPKHTQLRRAAIPLFGGDPISALEPVIRERANEILDRAQQKRNFDLVATIAVPFPSTVVYQDVLGFQKQDLKAAIYWGDLFNRAHAIPTGDRELLHTTHSSAIELQRLYQYGVAAFHARRNAPSNDILSILANMTNDEAQLISVDHFLSYFWSLVIGAYDTTAGTIASAIAILTCYPEQRELLYDDLSLVESAVEEFLRWESPVIYFRRTASVDYELSGQLIRKGDRVAMCFASANRDDEVFMSPDALDISRRPNHHVSFGHGSHFCLGARLARFELRILFEEIIKRRICFNLTGPIIRARSNFINRIIRMPVSLS